MRPTLPTGLYDTLVTQKLKELLGRIPGELLELQDVDPGEAHDLLARHLHDILRSVLSRLKGDGPTKQLELCNLLLKTIQHSVMEQELGQEQIESPARSLLAIDRQELGHTRPARPVVPLHASALLVNEGEKLSIGAALKREMESADAVDLICAFVNHTGVRILEPEIKALCQRGKLRLITTTYLGATQRKAIDHLHKLGAEIKITYELPPANTRLHAKAWLFHRNSGFPTAYIGSSNLSHTALIDGLEWNVRLSNVDAGQIIDRFQSTFDRYWADSSFESYDPQRGFHLFFHLSLERLPDPREQRRDRLWRDIMLLKEPCPLRTPVHP